MFCKRAGHTALDILEGVVKIRLKIIRLLRVNWMNVVAKISSESFIETYIGKKLDFWMKKKTLIFTILYWAVCTATLGATICTGPESGKLNSNICDVEVTLPHCSEQTYKQTFFPLLRRKNILLWPVTRQQLHLFSTFSLYAWHGHFFFATDYEITFWYQESNIPALFRKLV